MSNLLHLDHQVKSKNNKKRQGGFCTGLGKFNFPMVINAYVYLLDTVVNQTSLMSSLPLTAIEESYYWLKNSFKTSTVSSSENYGCLAAKIW